VYWAVRRYEQKFSPTINTETFMQHLKVRDFWRYYCLCHGNKVEREYGILDTPKFEWITNFEIIQRWRVGQTGIPLIDALMRELVATGYMSNRGRHLCAMYLTLDLRQDWRYGAYWFETYQIDQDYTVNYGSWNLCAGLNKCRTELFNVLKESMECDKQGNFIRKWCSELRQVPTQYIHCPWTIPKNKEKEFNIIIGKTYPYPIDLLQYSSSNQP
jgi:deoxyribodipyrimidine photo-lyase